MNIGRIGVSLIEEAIISALELQAAPLGASDISRITGIFRGPKPLNDAIVSGVLYKMLAEGRIIHKDRKWSLP